MSKVSGPIVPAGSMAPRPCACHAHDVRTCRATPEELFDHAWLRPVSDHYIEFINPVLWSLGAGFPERASEDYPTSAGRLSLYSGQYLGPVRRYPIAYSFPGRTAAAAGAADATGWKSLVQ